MTSETPGSDGFRAAADIGGTFTDIAVLAPGGSLATTKVLSTPTNYADAVIAGILGLVEQLEIAPEQVGEVLHGCTVATNAILEHKGARTALITTAGFRDVLELRRVRVPRLYDPLWEKPVPLVPRHRRLEVDERIGAAGEVVRALDEASVERAIERIAASGAEAVAVSLLNSFANPAHEQRIKARLREKLPRCFISVSADVLPQIREYERTSTAVINAYVGPVVRAYLESMMEQLSARGLGRRLLIMQSSGGVISAEAVLERPAEIIECGPAAGVIGARHLGVLHGYTNIITFDMGGTTAKASLIERGSVARSEEYEVGAAMSTSSALMGGAGYALKLPVIDISEVGAGGGSLVRIDKAGVIKVGPGSAGADPGPVCYSRGGREPTVTDANVVLGYLNPQALAAGTVPIDARAAEESLREQIARPLGRDLIETAYGIHLIANTNMMRAVKAVTTQRGRDTRDFAMFAFGGSGGVHAAALARELRIGQVVVPPAAGVFSALGLLLADMELNEARAYLRALDQAEADEMEGIYATMAEGIAARLGREPGEIAFQRLADLRYRGQAFELSVPLPERAIDAESRATLGRRFDAEHERRYGHCFEGQYPHEVVNLRLVGRVAPPRPERLAQGPGKTASRPSIRSAFFGPRWGMCETPIGTRSGLGRDPMRGPMIVEEDEGTVVVPPDASARVDVEGNLVVELDG